MNGLLPKSIVTILCLFYYFFYYIYKLFFCMFYWFNKDWTFKIKSSSPIYYNHFIGIYVNGEAKICL